MVLTDAVIIHETERKNFSSTVSLLKVSFSCWKHGSWPGSEASCMNTYQRIVVAVFVVVCCCCVVVGCLTSQQHVIVSHGVCSVVRADTLR